MKTYIIQLEAYDDLVSVRDKMGWAKNGRIVIVWPVYEAVLNRKLDLLLIQRRSLELGSQLALVSRDPEVRYQAPRLGIPVFRDLRKAQELRWRLSFRFRRKGSMNPEEYRQIKDELDRNRPREKPAIDTRPLKPAIRLAAFLAGILAFLSMAATLAPSARVTLTPKTMVQDVILNIRTSPEINETNLSGAIPSDLVMVQVEARDTIPVTGKVRLPTSKSIGEVEFTNLTDQVVVIPAGTVVRTADDEQGQFETLQRSEAPSGPGTTVRAAIRCLLPGENGNHAAGSLTLIEGSLGTELAVTNPEATRGGTDRVEPAPSPKDMEILAERLEKTLQETALQEIQSKIASGDMLIHSSLQLVQTLQETASPKVGEPADEITLSKRLEFQARVIRFQTITELIEMVFNTNLPQSFEPIPDSLQIEVAIAPEKSETGDFTAQLHASRRAVARIPETKAIQLALGVSPSQAVSQLQASLPLEEPPFVQLQPVWWPRLPILPFRIVIQNQNLTEPGASGS